MLGLVWELLRVRVWAEVVWAAAKKIDGARKPNSKEFWARGRDSFDYMYGITGGKGRDRARKKRALYCPVWAKLKFLLVFKKIIN